MVFENKEQFFDAYPQWVVKRRTETIGFTSGCFDLLNAGHVGYLEMARQECDFLIVGLPTDESVRRSKGYGRPIQDEKTRGLVLSSLKSVGAVIQFHQDTPFMLILGLQLYLSPGIDRLFVSEGEEPSGESIIKGLGGKVKVLPRTDHPSTTDLIEKIQNETVKGSPDIDSIKKQLKRLRGVKNAIGDTGPFYSPFRIGL